MNPVYDVLRYANVALAFFLVATLIVLCRDKKHEWTFPVKVIFGWFAYKLFTDAYSTLDLLSKGVPSGFRNLVQFVGFVGITLALFGVMPHWLEPLARRWRARHPVEEAK